MRSRPPCLPGVLLLCVALLSVAVARPGAANAQPPGEHPATHASAAALSPAQAASALDILRDDKRRAALIGTLEAIAAAAPPLSGPASSGTASSGPAPPASAPSGPHPGKAPATEAAAKLPLVPNSLGARLIAQVSATLASAGTQAADSLAAVNDLPLLYDWLVGQANDPQAQAQVLDAAWKLLAVMAAALFAEWVTRRGVRRLRPTLSFGARTQPPPPPVPDLDDAEPDKPEPATPDLVLRPPADATTASRSERQRRLSGTISALRRLPFLLLRLLLDLLPIAVFAGVGAVLLDTRLGSPLRSRLVIVAVVEAYILARLVLAVAGMLVSPESPRERLLHISDWAAAFLSRWITRIVIIAITGYGIAEVGLLFGMYRVAYETLLKAFALVVHLFLVMAVLQARKPVAKRIHARHGETGVWSLLQNRLSEVWHLVAIALIMGLWLVWAVELRNGYARLLSVIAETAAVVAVSRLVATTALGGFERLRIGPVTAARHPGLEARMNAYNPLVRGLILVIVAIGTVTALLEVWGVDVIGWFEVTGLGSQAMSAISLIALTILIGVLVWEGANAWIDAHLVRLAGSAQAMRAGRLRTLLPMLRTVLFITLLLIVGLTTLSELGLNIAPLLAGAGVLGIAVGFGSQKLVQDLITGLFLLLENAMQVGDIVTLGGLTGTVEALSIRTIRLRSVDGSMHIIPFSAVTTVTNQTRDYGYALLEISVGLDEEPERIRHVLKEVAETMRADESWADILLDPLEVMGMDRFLDTAWVMRARIKTLPSSRWAVGRELNRRIKERFDALAIESPITSPRAITAAAEAAKPEPTPA